MTNPVQATEDFCPNCTKAGLPILPLRYAIARDDATVKERAPSLVAPFGASVEKITLPANSAKYTLRTLRSGYLYVFNEVRGEWKAYEVDELGTLFEFDIRDKSPPPAPEDEIREVCSRHGSPDLSRCIIIPNAHAAGAVWIGFSNVAWTKPVWDRHRQQAYREKHMRRIDIGAWVKSQGANTQPHMASLSMLPERVGEYALPLPDPTGSEESEAARNAREARNRARLETRIADPRLMTGGEPDDSDAVAIELEPVVVTGKKYPAFDFSLADFRNNVDTFEQFLNDAVKAGERGKAVGGSSGPYTPLMVAVDDPTGIAMDLASLMNVRLSDFMKQPGIKRPLGVSTVISSLEEGIRSNAELELVKSKQDAAARELEYWRSIPWTSGEGPRDPARYQMESRHHQRMRDDPAYRDDWNRKVEQARTRALSGLSKGDLQNAADSAWSKYRNKLVDGQPDRWQREVYRPALQRFDQSVIVPLAKVHARWLQSQQLTACMTCNHDQGDPESGVAYCHTVLLCIQDTQAISVSSELYANWLGASKVEEDNLLLQAIALNQQAVLDTLAAGTGISLRQASTLPWGLLLDGYNRALRELPAGQQNTPARLLVALSGPVMAALDQALNRGVGPLVVSLGLVSRQPVIHMRLTGTLDEAIDDLVRRMISANPELGGLDRDRLRARMRNQSAGRRQVTRARGTGMRGRNDISIFVDQLAVGEIDSGMNPQEKLRRAGQSVMTFEEWQRSPSSRWRTMTNGINAGIVGVLLSVWSLKSLARELDESSARSRTENQWRYSAAVLGVVAATSDGLHTALQNGRDAGSRFATRMHNGLNRLLRFAGRALGFAAAVIFAVWDGINGVKAIKRGEVGVGVLYLASATSSVLAFAALAGWFGPMIFGLSATGVGIVLAVIAIAAAVLITWFKDDVLEAWMRRCWFGSVIDGRFETHAEEMAELDAILKAS